MIPTAEIGGLLQRADSLARKLASREVDRAELRRVTRFLARQGDLRILQRLLKNRAPRQAGRSREHWLNIGELVGGELGRWLEADLSDAGRTERVAYVLGWAARLQQYYEAVQRGKSPGVRRGGRPDE